MIAAEGISSLIAVNDAEWNAYPRDQRLSRAFNRARLMAPGIARTVQFMDKYAIDNDSLNGEMRNIIEEARVILPGVQALFGFQTIA
ncbi:MAG TPA: hypothetical protein VGD30_00560, partial [Telluria sp.]